MDYIFLCIFFLYPKKYINFFTLYLPKSEASLSSWNTGALATLLKLFVLLYLKSVEGFLELPTMRSSPSCQKRVEMLATHFTLASPFSLKCSGAREMLSVLSDCSSWRLKGSRPVRLRGLICFTPCSI